jgi:hypothetical protein
MRQNVLVIGENSVVRDALEFLLLGRAKVRHAHAASEAEGIGIDVVVVSDPGLAEHIRDISVHPSMASAPIVALTGSPGNVFATSHLRVVDTRTPEVLDDLTEQVSILLARAGHPAAGPAVEVVGAA